MLHLRPSHEKNPHFSLAFSCNRILENTDHYLLEVERNSINSFFPNLEWFKISKDLLQVTPLNLKALDSSYDIEERFFDEGYLKFNATTGVFIEKFNSGQHKYQLLECSDVSNTFTKTLQTYFSDCKMLMN